jgi:hypothetical protein
LQWQYLFFTVPLFIFHLDFDMWLNQAITLLVIACRVHWLSPRLLQSMLP